MDTRYTDIAIDTDQRERGIEEGKRRRRRKKVGERKEKMAMCIIGGG